MGCMGGEVLPQKSTDFFPKLMSGITMYRVKALKQAAEKVPELSVILSGAKPNDKNNLLFPQPVKALKVSESIDQEILETKAG